MSFCSVSVPETTPGTLDESEQQRWLNHRREALSEEKISQYFEHLSSLINQYSDQPEKISLLQALARYAQELLS